MELEVGIPLMKDLRSSLYLRQPSWMNKGRYGELVELLPDRVESGEGAEEQENVVEDVLLLVEKVRDEGVRFLPASTPEPVLGGGEQVDPDEMGMDRVWFWLSVALPDLELNMMKMNLSDRIIPLVLALAYLYPPDRLFRRKKRETI